jgi:hypothetical protein
MISPERVRRQLEFEKFILSKQIGIFGYFSQSRIEELIKVKKFLVTKNFNAKMSNDLEKEYKKNPKETNQEYAIRLSEILFKTSEICIFVLISPKKPSDLLLDSPSMEYGWAFKDRRSYVGVYCQKGCKLSTLPQGALTQMRESWTGDDFDDIEETFPSIKKYCESSIFEMIRE